MLKENPTCTRRRVLLVELLHERGAVVLCVRVPRFSVESIYALSKLRARAPCPLKSRIEGGEKGRCQLLRIHDP